MYLSLLDILATKYKSIMWSTEYQYCRDLLICNKPCVSHTQISTVFRGWMRPMFGCISYTVGLLALTSYATALLSALCSLMHANVSLQGDLMMNSRSLKNRGYLCPAVSCIQHYLRAMTHYNGMGWKKIYICTCICGDIINRIHSFI